MLLFLLACASNSCASYVEAARACAESAGGDPDPYDEASICGTWTPTLEEAYGAWYRCQAAAWDASACVDGADVVEAAGVAGECSVEEQG